MKDLPHHIKKLVRKITRSYRREEMENTSWEAELKKPQTIKQQKKQAKKARKEEKENRLPHPKEPEERNKEMKKRTPEIRDRDSKTPRN